MRCLIMALVVGVCVMAMAGPAQAIKVTVINETNDGWYFTLHSQKYYGCVDYVTAHATHSCSAITGITIREVNVTRYDPTKFYWDCPESIRCRFRSDPAIKESRVVVTIKRSGIQIKRKDGTVLESCPQACGAVKAYLAGCDLVLMCHTPQAALEALEKLTGIFMRGEADPMILRVKASRILAAQKPLSHTPPHASEMMAALR